jgi:hypothetical protein
LMVVPKTKVITQSFILFLSKKHKLVKLSGIAAYEYIRLAKTGYICQSYI